MWKTGKCLFANGAFKSINVHAESLKEGDNKPRIVAMAVQHAHISTAFTAIYVMDNTGIS
jgi:hypothetical protein